MAAVSHGKPRRRVLNRSAIVAFGLVLCCRRAAPTPVQFRSLADPAPIPNSAPDAEGSRLEVGDARWTVQRIQNSRGSSAHTTVVDYTVQNIGPTAVRVALLPIVVDDRGARVAAEPEATGDTPTAVLESLAAPALTPNEQRRIVLRYALRGNRSLEAIDFPALSAVYGMRRLTAIPYSLQH